MPLERELLATDFRMTLGSSSAIVAHNLAALGVSVGFITRLGDDALGSIALERLAERGVDLTCVKRVSGSTSTGVTILLNHGGREGREGKRHILTYPGTMFEMVAADLDMAYLASSRHFHLSSFFLHKALQPDLARICRQLKSEGLTLSLDTNDDPDDRWGGGLDELLGIVDVFFPMRMRPAGSPASLMPRAPLKPWQSASRWWPSSAANSVRWCRQECSGGCFPPPVSLHWIPLEPVTASMPDSWLHTFGARRRMPARPLETVPLLSLRCAQGVRSLFAILD
jgi:sugar/nucleoside kinase (ribokinase family)